MDILTSINTSKVLAGITMIAMNFGSRYVIGDLTTFQDEMLKSELAKRFVLWCICFVATRDVLIATMLTFAFYITLHGLLNENKPYSLFFTPIPFAQVYASYNEMVNGIRRKNVL